MRVMIDYKPQTYQREIHRNPCRFKVLCIGRRGGKTEFVLNELIKESVKLPGLYWYIAPSYRQAKSIAWVRLKTLLKPAYTQWKFNEQELYAENVGTGARIELKGADNEESLLGVGLKGVVFDESAMIKDTVWPRIVRPMLAESQGWAIFISTPKGRNWFFDLYQKGLDLQETDWQSWHYPTSVNEYVPKSEIDEMRKDMSERIFMQEVQAEFLDDETGVFKGVKRCITGEFEPPVLGRFYVMGVDLAKVQDFTVLVVIDSVTRHVVAFDRFQDVSWREQKLRIQGLAQRYNNALCLVDSTGVGDPVVEDLQNANVSVEGIRFNNKNKFDLINNLAIAIEQRYITFPRIEVLIQELMDFEYTLTNAGNVQYSAPSGKHDDCVTSLGLATYGIRHQLKEFQTISEMETQKYEDRQGRGERVDFDEEEDRSSGY